jgi:hypothetical protein
MSAGTRNREAEQIILNVYCRFDPQRAVGKGGKIYGNFKTP